MGMKQIQKERVRGVIANEYFESLSEVRITIVADCAKCKPISLLRIHIATVLPACTCI